MASSIKIKVNGLGGAPGAGTSSAQTCPRSVCGHSTWATQTSPAIASRQCSKYDAGSGASRIRSPTKTSSTMGSEPSIREAYNRPPVDVSARIARHVASTTAESIPDAALEAAKRSLLDAIGVSVAASGLAPECLPFVRLARARARRRRPARCSGSASERRRRRAVFANGALAHALDFEDAHDPSLSHPNAQTVPVLLALAESEGGISGRDFLAAQAVGCDLTCRLSLALGQALAARGWYPPSLLAGFGATAAAANLLRLDERQTLDAFSLVLGQLGSHGQILGSTRLRHPQRARRLPGPGGARVGAAGARRRSRGSTRRSRGPAASARHTRAGTATSPRRSTRSGASTPARRSASSRGRAAGPRTPSSRARSGSGRSGARRRTRSRRSR